METLFGTSLCGLGNCMVGNPTQILFINARLKVKLLIKHVDHGVTALVYQIRHWNCELYICTGKGQPL